MWSGRILWVADSTKCSAAWFQNWGHTWIIIYQESCKALHAPWRDFWSETLISHLLNIQKIHMTELLLYSKILVNSMLSQRKYSKSHSSALLAKGTHLYQYGTFPLEAMELWKHQAEGVTANWRRHRTEQNIFPDLPPALPLSCGPPAVSYIPLRHCNQGSRESLGTLFEILWKEKVFFFYEIFSYTGKLEGYFACCNTFL